MESIARNIITFLRAQNIIKSLTVEILGPTYVSGCLVNLKTGFRVLICMDLYNCKDPCTSLNTSMVWTCGSQGCTLLCLILLKTGLQLLVCVELTLHIHTGRSLLVLKLLEQRDPRTALFISICANSTELPQRDVASPRSLCIFHPELFSLQLINSPLNNSHFSSFWQTITSGDYVVKFITHIDHINNSQIQNIYEEFLDKFCPLTVTDTSLENILPDSCCQLPHISIDWTKQVSMLHNCNFLNFLLQK